MRTIRTLVALAALCVASPKARSDGAKATLSDESLSADQLEVYRTVVGEYLRDSKDVTNVADTTRPFDFHFSIDKSCLRRIGLKELPRASVVHHIPAALASDLKIRIVESKRQRRLIQENDPEETTERIADHDGRISKKQVEDSVDAAYANGELELSEIVFDAKHEHALVYYRFVCGGSCGNGDMLLLHKVHNKWKILRICADWVS